MPKQTFFNLADEKRDLIVEIALDEFADNDYDAASISRIVSRAGIAKGSFYQYFDDKEDLYRYLLGYIVQKKADFFSLDHPDPEHIGIFNYLRWIFANSAEFEAAYPRFSRLGYRMLKGGPSENRVFKQMVDSSLAYYRKLVTVGKEQGDIAADIDSDVAASMLRIFLAELGREIIQSIIDQYGTAWQGKTPVFDFPEARHQFDQMLRILELGLAGRPAVASGVHEEPESDTARKVTPSIVNKGA